MTPREKFRQNRSFTKGYNETINSDQIQAALDAASLQYDHSMAPAVDVTTAAANRWRKEGADTYRKILENLNADSVAPPPTTVTRLDHNV